MITWVLLKCRKLLVALNSAQAPEQLAGGVVIGFLIGVIPANFLIGILMFLLLFLLNVNRGFGVLAILLTRLVSYLFDGIFHVVGLFFLTKLGFLAAFWSFLEHAPVLAWLNLTNSVMLGSLVLGLVLSPLVYFGMIRFVLGYRHRRNSRV